MELLDRYTFAILPTKVEGCKMGLWTTWCFWPFFWPLVQPPTFNWDLCSCEVNAIALASLIPALAKGSQWQLSALHLRELRRLQDAGQVQQADWEGMGADWEKNHWVNLGHPKSPWFLEKTDVWKKLLILKHVWTLRSKMFRQWRYDSKQIWLSLRQLWLPVAGKRLFCWLNNFEAGWPIQLPWVFVSGRDNGNRRVTDELLGCKGLGMALGSILSCYFMVLDGDCQFLGIFRWHSQMFEGHARKLCAIRLWWAVSTITVLWTTSNCHILTIKTTLKTIMKTAVAAAVYASQQVLLLLAEAARHEQVDTTLCNVACTACGRAHAWPQVLALLEMEQLLLGGPKFWLLQDPKSGRPIYIYIYKLYINCNKNPFW